MPRTRSRRRSTRRRRAIAWRCTQGVMLLHGVVLVTFFGDLAPPAGGGLFELLWAWAHEASFYPLVGLILAGIPLSLLAGVIRGRHRYGLAGSWLVFAVLAGLFHADRLTVMLRILWAQISG